MAFGASLFTALNFEPSTATLAAANKPNCRHSATNRAQTLRMAGSFSGELIPRINS